MHVWAPGNLAYPLIKGDIKMLSHKNLQEQIKKNEPTKQRFAIKKLSVGVASVLLGVTFAGTASADTTDANSTSDSESAGAEQTDHNNDETGNCR